MVTGNHFPETFVVAIGVVVVVASVVVVAVVVVDALACIDGVVVVASIPSVDVAVQYNVGLGMEMTLVLLGLMLSPAFVSMMLNCSIWLFWLTSLKMRGKLDETSDSDPLGGSLPPPPSNSEKCEMRCIEARVVAEDYQRI